MAGRKQGRAILVPTYNHKVQLTVHRQEARQGPYLCSKYHSPTSSARRPAKGAAMLSLRSSAFGISLGAISLLRSCRYLCPAPPQ